MKWPSWVKRLTSNSNRRIIILRLNLMIGFGNQTLLHSLTKWTSHLHCSDSNIQFLGIFFIIFFFWFGEKTKLFLILILHDRWSRRTGLVEFWNKTNVAGRWEWEGTRTSYKWLWLNNVGECECIIVVESCCLSQQHTWSDYCARERHNCV